MRGGIKNGFAPEDISLCSTKREEYTGHSEINARVVVLQIQLILTLGGTAATLRSSDFGLFLAFEKGNSDEDYMTIGLNSSGQNVIFNVTPGTDAMVNML